MIYLQLEDIVANAIIELYKKNGTRHISLEHAKRYGEEIVRRLNRLGFFAKIKLGSRVEEHFEKEYANYFTMLQTENGKEYYVNLNKTIDEIMLKFRCTLPIEIIPLFENIDIEKNCQNTSWYQVENNNHYEKKSCDTSIKIIKERNITKKRKIKNEKKIEE